MLKYAVIVLCCLMWWVGVSASSACKSRPTSALKFTIRSLRNQTGHWIAQVHLGHDSTQKDVGPWEVEVDHSTVKCEDTETIEISACITGPSAVPMSSKPPGYELIKNLGYYKMNPDLLSWHDARAACRREGSDLFIANSEQEVQAMHYFWQKYPSVPGYSPNRWAWVGFHDQFKEGEHVTVLGEPLASAGYLKWNEGDPTGQNENCGMMGRSNFLADAPCSDKTPSICEMKL